MVLLTRLGGRQFWIRFLQNRTLTTISFVGLSISFACCMLIGLWIRDELNVDAFHNNGSRIFQVLTDYNRPDGSVETKTKTFYPVKDLLDQNIPEILSTVILNKSEIVISQDLASVQAEGYYASENFFDVFSFPTVAGNKNHFLKDPYGILISETMAGKLFPRVVYDQVIGRSLTVNGNVDVQVTGIFKDVPPSSSLQFGFVLTMKLNLNLYPWNKDFGNHNHLLFAQVQPDVSIDDIENKTNDIVAKLMRSNPNKPNFWFYPFERLYLYGNIKNGIVQGGRIDYVRLLAVVALLVLALSIVNFTTLTIARNSKYLKQDSIRKYLGASESALANTVYFDTLCIVTFSFALALGIIVLLEPSLHNLTGKPITIDFSNIQNWLIALTAIVALTLIGGSYPAFVHSKTDQVRLVKSSSTLSGISAKTRNGFVILQFFLCMSMLAIAFVSREQVKFIMNKNLGFESDKVIAYPVQYHTPTTVARIKTALLQSPSLVSVSGSDQSPMMVQNKNETLNWAGKEDGETIEMSHLKIDHNFTRTLNVEVVAGRDFSEEILGDTSNFIVNETAVKAIGLNDPVGTPMEGLGRKGVIVGVVRDFHNQLLYSPISPMVLYLDQPTLLYIKVSNLNALNSIKEIHDKYSPEFPFVYRFMDDEVEKLYRSEIVMSKMVDYFAMLALLISILGLVGLVSFSTKKRMKEIGVRKVFGATSTNICMLLVTDYLRTISMALIIAMPVIYLFASKWLSRFSYAIELSWINFIAPGIVIIIVSIAVIVMLVTGASRTNPVYVLKQE